MGRKEKQPFFQYGLKEISIVSNDYHQLRKEMQKSYLPNVVYLGAKQSSNLESLKMKIPENRETNLHLSLPRSSIYRRRDGAVVEPQLKYR